MATPKTARSAQATAALRRRILRLRDVDHLSQREIGRRIGISESFVRDIIKGRRNVSTAKGRSAIRQAATAHNKMMVIPKGENTVRTVSPVSRRDASKIGKYWSSGKGRGVGYAIENGEYDIIRQTFSSKDLTVRTTEGTVHLEDDPEVLEHLDRADMLQPQDIIVGKYRKR
jgi:hypothetical protein